MRVTATLEPKKLDDGFEVLPRVGDALRLDNGKVELLLEGDGYVDSGFPGCQFRFPNPVRGWETKHALAVNLKVTGRTVKYAWGARWVRVQVEWVGDCEPSTFCGGWVKV